MALTSSIESEPNTMYLFNGLSWSCKGDIWIISDVCSTLIGLPENWLSYTRSPPKKPNELFIENEKSTN